MLDSLRCALGIAEQNLRRAQDIVRETLTQVNEFYHYACQEVEEKRIKEHKDANKA